jgi:hypothetical protein
MSKRWRNNAYSSSPRCNCQELLVEKIRADTLRLNPAQRASVTFAEGTKLQAFKHAQRRGCSTSKARASPARGRASSGSWASVKRVSRPRDVVARWRREVRAAARGGNEETSDQRYLGGHGARYSPHTSPTTRPSPNPRSPRNRYEDSPVPPAERPCVAIVLR